MSNRITITRTIFTPYAGKDTTSTIGYRMYDDYGQIYDNTLTSEEMKLPDDKLLQYIRDNDNEVSNDMLSSLRDNGGSGICIDGDYYDADWVKKVLDTEE